MASTALSLLSLLPLIAAYSFELTAAPTQCGPLSLRITNGSGKPPYTALVVPFGPSPGAVEQRTVFQHEFTSENVSFSLPYPASSSFVAMVSDSDGIGTGGTGVPTNVASSSNSSCLTTSPATSYSFQIIPNNAINQCQTTTLAWDNNTQGDPSFLLVIPGGQSSRIDIVNSGPALGGTTGFSWTPNLRAGATILLVAGDARGPGTGGSINTAVGNSPTGNSSCLDSSSPSSTAGTPAGAIQTATSSGTSTPGSGSMGSLTALAIIALVAFVFIRRRRRQRHPIAHNVDLLPDGTQRDPDQPPEFYQPEPFIVPPSLSHTGADEDRGSHSQRLTMSDVGRRYSALSTTDQSESAYGTTTGTSGNMLAMGEGAGRSTTYGPGSSRKSPMGMPPLRPVNFVQHEDGGELPEASGSGQADEPETVELPPSYQSVRR
ncbi:hypothetical protein JB92DRAFT_2853649 [Gautieria morchelliformis]|nr:hypothetical protein JB92DRAFT_2853649 [Gautieria morchelliformis]